MKKLLTVTLVMVFVLGLMGGVVMAESGVNTEADFEVEYKAAPAVAGELLEKAGIDNRYGTGRDGGNYIRDVAHYMDGTDFDGVCKTDVDEYAKAVARFLRDKGLDVGEDLFKAVLESVVYEGTGDLFGNDINDKITFTFSADVFHDPNVEVTFQIAQELWEGWGADNWTMEGNTAILTLNRVYSSPRNIVGDNVIAISGMLDELREEVIVPAGGVEVTRK